MTGLFIVFGGGFRRLVSFFSVANWTFFFATVRCNGTLAYARMAQLIVRYLQVLGLLVLRVKEPNLERPYRANLATPIVFCAVALFLLIMPIVAAPVEAAAAFGAWQQGATHLCLRRLTARRMQASSWRASQPTTSWSRISP